MCWRLITVASQWQTSCMHTTQYRDSSDRSQTTEWTETARQCCKRTDQHIRDPGQYFALTQTSEQKHTNTSHSHDYFYLRFMSCSSCFHQCLIQDMDMRNEAQKFITNICNVYFNPFCTKTKTNADNTDEGEKYEKSSNDWVDASTMK